MSERLTRKQIAELAGCRESEIPTAPLWNLTNYTPPGPVGAAYVRSAGPIDAITGPAGSGKTVASVFKPVRFSVGVMPVCMDKIIRVRGTVLRDNYRALYRTTLRSWFEWFPPNWNGAEFFGGQDRPARHILKLATVREVDGQRIEVPVNLEVDFFAVADVSIEEMLKGYETSWGWCNEGDLLAENVLPFLYSRTGRYPPLKLLPAGTARPRMVQVDFNPPDPDHVLLQACQRGSFQAEADAPKVINFFQQPSGLSRNAENRSGKSYEAYAEEARTMSTDDVRRFVHGLPGRVKDGKPVYEDEFNYQRHVAAGRVPVLPELPLHIGFDQGLSPAALFCQQAPNGQLRFLDEVVPDHGTGAERFIEMLLPHLLGRFRGLQLGLLASDPAGWFGVDKVMGQLSWAEMIGKALGHQLVPAPTNEWAPRRESLSLLMRRDVMAETPALLIDPACRTFVRGLSAGYKYRKEKNGYSREPIKNTYADAVDAACYIALTLRGLAGVIAEVGKAGRAGELPRRDRPVQARADFNVFDV